MSLILLYIYICEYLLSFILNRVHLQSVPQEKVRVYSESFEENLIFLFWHNSAHKALGCTHLMNRPIAVVLDNGLAPSGHALDTPHIFYWIRIRRL